MSQTFGQLNIFTTVKIFVEFISYFFEYKQFKLDILFCKTPCIFKLSCRQLVLTILTWKNLHFTEFSTKIHWDTRLAASDVFLLLSQLSSFNFIIVQMSGKRELVASCSNFYDKTWVGFCLNIRKLFFLDFPL